MAFLKEFFQNVDFEKNQQTTKKHANFHSRQRVKYVLSLYFSSIGLFRKFHYRPILENNVFYYQSHMQIVFSLQNSFLF